MPLVSGYSLWGRCYSTSLSSLVVHLMQAGLLISHLQVMNLVESVGTNYYMLAIQIAGIGTLMTGINFDYNDSENESTWHDIDENANVYMVCFNH